MSKKKAFALRIDEETMKAIEKWAADEFRSTNGQLEWVIREALKKAGRLPKNEHDKENTSFKPDCSFWIDYNSKSCFSSDVGDV